MRTENSEIDFESYEEGLEDKVESLKCDLLDIEIKLGDALRTAFGQFETRLKNIKQKMVDESSSFAEDATFEAQVFARAIKVHGMDSHEALKNHFELITDDKQAEEETEVKMAEIGETLFKFLLYEDTEDVKVILDGVEDECILRGGGRIHYSTPGKFKIVRRNWYTVTPFRILA